MVQAGHCFEPGGVDLKNAERKTRGLRAAGFSFVEERRERLDVGFSGLYCEKFWRRFSVSRSLIRIFGVVAVIVSLSSVCEGQAAAKAPTIDQSLEMYSVGSPKISPDGKRVVYEQTRTNWDAKAF
jgi:hypothetical protein